MLLQDDMSGEQSSDLPIEGDGLDMEFNTSGLNQSELDEISALIAEKVCILYYEVH